MVLVGRVVVVRHAPLVAREDGARLQHPLDLRVDLDTVRRVAGRLDGVGRVEGAVLERHLHEVALHALALPFEALRAVQLIAAVHLVLVQRDARDVGLGEARDVPHRAADAAAHVQHFGAGVRAQAAGEVVLVALDRAREGLALEAVGEVEALAPSPLVEQGAQVVVGVHQRLVGRIAPLRAVRLVQLVVRVDAVVHLRAAGQLALLAAELRQHPPRAAQRVTLREGLQHHLQQQQAAQDSCHCKPRLAGGYEGWKTAASAQIPASILQASQYHRRLAILPSKRAASPASGTGRRPCRRTPSAPGARGSTCWGQCEQTGAGTAVVRRRVRGSCLGGGTDGHEAATCAVSGLRSAPKARTFS
eukprot:scaffold1220_cov259-Pinguiococcus_pyrenoidosus.AAC.41